MKRQKWFILVLLISLILNIFMVGILLGKHLFLPPMDDHAMLMRPPHPKHLFWALKQLPNETRQKIEPLVQKQFQHEQIRAEMRQTHELFIEIQDMVTTESLDKIAIQQQFEILQQKRANIAKRLYEGLLNIAEQLNQTERQQLMQAMRHDHQQRPPHHRFGSQ